MIIGSLANFLDVWAMERGLVLTSAKREALLELVNGRVTDDSSDAEIFQYFADAFASAEYTIYVEEAARSRSLDAGPE